MLRTWLNAFKNDEAQMLRLRRMSISLVGGVVLCGICIVYYYLGVFRTDAKGLIYLLSGFWIINILFIFTLLSGLNKKFSDPSLTFSQMFWAITAIMIAVYYSNEYRNVLLMMCLLIFSFGGLYLKAIKFGVFLLYSIFIYVLIIVLLNHIPGVKVDIKQESISLFVYSLVAFSYYMFVFELGGLRKHMHYKTGTLSSSLQVAKSELMIDPLTGVGNRRFIMSQLEHQRLMASRKPNYYFSCIFIDLDNFKQVNDTYGHIIGDKLLISFCNLMQGLIRKTEFFGRFGGEEFLVIIPMANTEEAYQIALRICKTIEETDFSNVTPGLKMTVSIGLAQFTWPESKESFLKKVDEAMYYAKKHGRNQVVVL